MKAVQILNDAIASGLDSLYQLSGVTVKIETTKKEFQGDYTFVVFPYTKAAGRNPEVLAQELGEWLKKEVSILAGYNVVKGFLNLVLSDAYWNELLLAGYRDAQYGKTSLGVGKKVMVEYSSPNTNKPLHLGHVRNNLLGWSISEILKFNGYGVVKVNLINDRGIHICKSMLAWMKDGQGETPESSGMKGDKLVGKYYVLFSQALKKEVHTLVEGGMSEEDAEKNAPLMKEAQALLQKWEAGDAETLNIWRTMNGWVYNGFDVTYRRLGCDFDRYYYESDTYLLGKKAVETGLEKNIFFKKEDGSVWIDLTADGLDQKLLLRADGTSVYITQDIGTAMMKYEDEGCDRSVYVVGNEQEYHFKVLKLILEKLEVGNASGVYHLSYGMVELPHGKLKSREGQTVEADELMEEMYTAAKEKTNELGKTAGLSAEALEELYESIGLSALKYFILKIDPVKKMVFNPEESIELHGNTGPFIQYTYARIRSVFRGLNAEYQYHSDHSSWLAPERALISLLERFPQIVADAAVAMSPAVIANYIFEVAQAYNYFYHECSILKEPIEAQRTRRLALSEMSAHTLRNGLHLLGIKTVERM